MIMTDIRRKALEESYDGVCTIIAKTKSINEDHSTGFEDAIIVENQSCRLSYETVRQNSSDNTEQIIKLFISPEVTVPSGSKIRITQNGNTNCFKRSGIPAVYDTHQEIVLELEERWA